MDRNSAIGLTLIAALLMAYFYFFGTPPKPTVDGQNPITQTVPGSVDERTPNANEPVQADSAATASAFGGLAKFATGRETPYKVETDDMIVIFSSKGGVIKELELKHYKTYSQEPLKLVSPTNSSFKLESAFEGKPVDLYNLYYQTEVGKIGDTTTLTYSVRLADGAMLMHKYKIPKKGYEINYEIVSEGIAKRLTGDNLSLQWNGIVELIEKDINDLRINSTVSYYTQEDGFDELSQRSTDIEKEVFSNAIKWVALKQKFFLNAIVAENSFAGGEIETSVNESDPTIAKRASMQVNIPVKELETGAAFKYYIGPNDYQVIGKVAPDFSKNVYLGWPPVFWVNKFIIFPVFHFLTQFIGNFGIIIIILVILMKLVLLPLSYKSYVGMAKMRVLKPELDEIKERNGDDMQKTQKDSMQLYQQVGVNPISGCLPLLLQMPILFAMFYLFPASIELRQQPLLWAEDLSTYDSVITFGFSLPILGNHISMFTLLMTLSTIVSTWQNNQISSVQGPMKSMGYLMPIIFFFVLNSFSAGLTFYYFVSNLVTFVQQILIRKTVDDDKIRAILEENRKKIAAGGGKKSKFMAKLESAMKASEEARKGAGEAKKKRK